MSRGCTSRESNNSYKGTCCPDYFEHITNRLTVTLHHFRCVISKSPSPGVEVSFISCGWTCRQNSMRRSGIKQLDSAWERWASVLEEILEESSLAFKWCSRLCISYKCTAVSGMLWSSVTLSWKSTYRGASALLLFEKKFLYPIPRSSTWQQMNC